MTTQAHEQDTEIAVRDWLIEKVAFYLEQPASAIESNVKLVEYGLDSVYALALCGDIEDEFDLEVEPTLAWDYPTIDAITGLLGEMITEKKARV